MGRRLRPAKAGMRKAIDKDRPTTWQIGHVFIRDTYSHIASQYLLSSSGASMGSRKVEESFQCSAMGDRSTRSYSPDSDVRAGTPLYLSPYGGTFGALGRAEQCHLCDHMNRSRQTVISGPKIKRRLLILP